MNSAEMLLTVTLAMPLAMLLACLSPCVRSRMPGLLALAPVPALVTALITRGDEQLTLPCTLLGATLKLDLPGAMLLGTAALLWIAAGVFAATYLRGKPNRESFSAWWLLAMTGNLGVFLAADIASFYLFFAMGSLAAYGLIVHTGTPSAWRAGAVYVGLALLGEACVLMGLVLLAAAAPANSLLIHDAVAGFQASPWRDATLALLLVGFGLKIGLVPLHVWMPLAYTAAPIPAAAVLSGAAVKAGVIGLIRFLPFGAGHADLGAALTAVGLFSAFYGVAIGITQANPKTVLAYSSVSQMGLIAAVTGMGLAAGDQSVVVATSFYAAHHLLAKGALFLAVGVVAVMDARRLWPVLLPAAVVALSIAGLPFTGGALSKAAVKVPLGDGIVGSFAVASAAATTLLMLHFLKCLAATAPQKMEGPASIGLTVPWLGMALATFVIPWALFPSIFSGNHADILSVSELWSALWPVLIGGMLAIGLWRRPLRLPAVPAGDLAVALEGTARAFSALSELVDRADVRLRKWPVAGIALLAISIMLGAAIAAGH